MKRFLLYLGRWQLSSPILAPIVALFTGSPIWGTWQTWAGTVVANIIGGAIFFWVDRFIFTSAAVEMWHFIPEGKCDECGKTASLWRLTMAPGYDKRSSNPKYYCMECSKKKTDELRSKGIKIKGRSH